MSDPAKAVPRSTWRERPLIATSIAIHGSAAAWTILRPAAWPWTLGAVAANHLVLAAAGLWPRSSLLGPNHTRLPSSPGTERVALTIDDGPDPEVTPRVLDILAQNGASATFFCVGERVTAHGALAREIVAQGHCIENHSQRHLHGFSLLGPKRMRAEVERAQQSIAAVTGRAPRFFRAPAGLRNPFLESVLSALDLSLVSWTRRGFDTVAREPALVLTRLTRNLATGDILLLHDGHAARTAAGTPVVLDVLPGLLAACRARRLETVTLQSAFT